MEATPAPLSPLPIGQLPHGQILGTPQCSTPTDSSALSLSQQKQTAEALQKAAATAEKEGQAALEAKGRADEAALLVVGAYLMPVVEQNGALRPTSQREAIRAKGPSICLDFGTQVLNGAARHV